MTMVMSLLAVTSSITQDLGTHGFVDATETRALV